MNKNSFGGHSILLLFVLGFITVSVVAGFGVVLTNQQCEQVGMSIKNLERQRDELKKKISAQEIHISTYTNQISLRKRVENMNLRRPSADQVIVVRRAGFSTAASFGQTTAQARNTDTGWGVLDIAFMMPAPTRGAGSQ
ncbi:MAG: hypothetical protein LBV12_06135 [Puniceicoccales bacterium]|jgi:hypothetical protein|nr:hypothetical protein [Puniceicoccales bacterium]